MSINKLLTALSILLLTSVPTTLCFAEQVIPESLKVKYYQHCYDGLAGDKYFGKDEYSEERTSYFEWSCKCATVHVLPILQADGSNDLVQDAYEKCFDYGLFQYVVNSFEDTDDVTQDKIETACQDTSKNIAKSPQDAAHKNLIQRLCQCAAPKLFKLNETEAISDEDYNNQVDTIASECTDYAHQ